MSVTPRRALTLPPLLNATTDTGVPASTQCPAVPQAITSASVIAAFCRSAASVHKHHLAEVEAQDPEAQVPEAQVPEIQAQEVQAVLVPEAVDLEHLLIQVSVVSPW